MTTKCPYCGRIVATSRDPFGRGVVMDGHHPTMPWKKGDPLCQGSGEEVERGD